MVIRDKENNDKRGSNTNVQACVCALMLVLKLDEMCLFFLITQLIDTLFFFFPDTTLAIKIKKCPVDEIFISKKSILLWF